MDALAFQPIRVEFSTVEDVRRSLFFELSKVQLPERSKVALAQRLTAKLRDEGWLATSVEQHYKAAQAAALLARTPEHVVKECKAGRFGTVYRDDGGWIIPASGIQRWLEQKIYTREVQP